MNSFLLFFANKINHILPDTKAFAFKRFLYRICGATIGNNVRLCSSCTILGDSSLEIGDNTWIGHDTIIICSAPVIIEKEVNIAPRVYIGTGSHHIDTNGPSIAGEGFSLPITIGEGSWICANASIMAGSVIGKFAIVALGAVVTESIPSGELWGGVPAKKIKEIK